MCQGLYQDAPATLPHPRISLAVFLVVEEALRVAWQRLKNRNPSRIDVATADEKNITHDLYEILHDEIYNKLVDGFDNEHFTDIVREPKLRNYNYIHLDKIPDLLIRMKDRERVDFSSQDALFIECKPVDAGHTVGAHYGSKGIMRFVRGDYAWAMQEALMVAYNHSDYPLVPKLTETMSQRASDFKVIEQPAACPKSLKTDCSPPVHHTQHERTFEYVETNQPAPPIRLRHLWLLR